MQARDLLFPVLDVNSCYGVVWYGMVCHVMSCYIMLYYVMLQTLLQLPGMLCLVLPLI